MKLAISGKGGVGKTTFAALLARTLDEQGKHVLAIDADPDANFAASLGIVSNLIIVPSLVILSILDLALALCSASILCIVSVLGKNKPTSPTLGLVVIL